MKQSFWEIPKINLILPGKSSPGANAALAEAEGLICNDNGLVVVGIFPIGGQLGQCPDAILCLQPTWTGARLLTTAAKFLVETRQVFTDRVRNPRAKARGRELARAILKNQGAKAIRVVARAKPRHTEPRNRKRGRQSASSSPNSPRAQRTKLRNLCHTWPPRHARTCASKYACNTYAKRKGKDRTSKDRQRQEGLTLVLLSGILLARTRSLLSRTQQEKKKEKSKMRTPQQRTDAPLKTRRSRSGSRTF